MEFKGLSSAEAAERFAKYGANELERKSRVTVLELFLGQFNNFIIILLIIGFR